MSLPDLVAPPCVSLPLLMVLLKLKSKIVKVFARGQIGESASNLTFQRHSVIEIRLAGPGTWLLGKGGARRLILA